MRAENPVNYTDIKADIIKRNVTLKISLMERWKKKWQKFKRKKRVVRQPKSSSNKVTIFELALQRLRMLLTIENYGKKKGVTYRRKRVF